MCPLGAQAAVQVDWDECIALCIPSIVSLSSHVTPQLADANRRPPLHLGKRATQPSCVFVVFRELCRAVLRPLLGISFGFKLEMLKMRFQQEV